MNAKFLAVCLIVAAEGVAFARPPIPCGKEWINLHARNPDLVGVYVQQVPDNVADAKIYRNKHPAMIVYVFKGNRAHQVSYTPTGQVESAFWWDIPEGHWVLDQMTKDFREGLSCGFWVKK